MPSSGKLKTYLVYYSQRAKAKVRAYSVEGARRKAWDMLGDFKHGWTKKDFLETASIKRAE